MQVRQVKRTTEDNGECTKVNVGSTIYQGNFFGSGLFGNEVNIGLEGGNKFGGYDDKRDIIYRSNRYDGHKEEVISRATQPSSNLKNIILT